MLGDKADGTMALSIMALET